LISAKLQTNPASSKNSRSLQKNYTSIGLRVETRVDMRISVGLLFMCDVLPAFQNAVYVAALQKYLILALQKWKIHFLWEKPKKSSVTFLAIPRATHVPDMGFF
jgi:hypothetical protein